jgi:8-oxo-dGTP pyrophosphatase MutT (NUDIX family)
MAAAPLEKVTAFITRKSDNGTELLLFKHPNAGIQLPAGTVEIGEKHDDAAKREAMEETGLTHFDHISYIDKMESNLNKKIKALLRKIQQFISDRTHQAAVGQRSEEE